MSAIRSLSTGEYRYKIKNKLFFAISKGVTTGYSEFFVVDARSVIYNKRLPVQVK